MPSNLHVWMQKLIKTIKHKLFLPIAGASIGVIAVCVCVWLYVAIAVSSPLKQQATLWIEPGSIGIRIAYLLERDNIIANDKMFLFALKASGKANQLHAGEYQFEAGASIWDVIQQISEGKAHIRQITVIEGHTVKRTLMQIAENPYLAGDISLKPKEGSLLPQTYSYHRGMQRDALISHMQQAMQDVLDELWAQRDKKISLKNKAEAIILASLVERETGIDAEREHIAAVFYNRLRNGWALQTDPTIIYWESKKLGFMDRPIRRSDLRRKQPFNTYLNTGLPPTAIANPGEAAIRAVLNPICYERFLLCCRWHGRSCVF